MATEPMDDAALFDAAMSDEAPVVETPPEQAAPETPPEPKDENRDPATGRFVPKAADAPETTTPPAQEPPQLGQKPEDEGAIPSWRLREVAQERNEARQRADAAEQRANEAFARMRALEQRIQSQQPPQEAPDWFERPQDATLHAVAPHLQAVRQQVMHMAHMVASQVHGAEKVKAADDAFSRAYATGQLDPADYQKVVNSPNVFDAAVQWHNRQTVFQQVGNDPEAWFNKRLETYLADPKNQAAVIERARGTAANGQNGSRPLVQLPPSIGRATSAAPAAEDNPDMSDAGLFRYAMR